MACDCSFILFFTSISVPVSNAFLFVGKMIRQGHANVIVTIILLRRIFILIICFTLTGLEGDWRRPPLNRPEHTFSAIVPDCVVVSI